MRTPQDCLVFHRPVGSRREPEIKVVLLAPITIICEGAGNTSSTQHLRSQDAIRSILLSHQPFLVRLSGLWVAAHPFEVIPSTKLIVWPQGSPQAFKRLMYFSFTKRSRHRGRRDHRCRPTSVRKEVVDSVCFCCGNIPCRADPRARHAPARRTYPSKTGQRHGHLQPELRRLHHPSSPLSLGHPEGDSNQTEVDGHPVCAAPRGHPVY